MASSPNISLPQIPADLDPKLKEYLAALTKVITAKQIDDYSKAEKDTNSLSQELKTKTDSVKSETMLVTSALDSRLKKAELFGSSRSANGAWDVAINLYNKMYPALYNAGHRTEATARKVSGTFHISGVIILFGMSHAWAREDGWLEIWGIYNANGLPYCIYINPAYVGYGGTGVNSTGWSSTGTVACAWSMAW